MNYGVMIEELTAERDTLRTALHTQAEESAKLLARVEVAEAGFKAAVSKAQWQARTNEELNRLVAQRDGLLGLLTSLCNRIDDEGASPLDWPEYDASIAAITKHTTTNEGK